MERDQLMENKKYLTSEEIYNLVSMLAEQQGFYSDVKHELDEDWERLSKLLENKFENEIDFMMWIEQQQFNHLSCTIKMVHKKIKGIDNMVNFEELFEKMLNGEPLNEFEVHLFMVMKEQLDMIYDGLEELDNDIYKMEKEIERLNNELKFYRRMYALRKQEEC